LAGYIRPTNSTKIYVFISAEWLGYLFFSENFLTGLFRISASLMAIHRYPYSERQNYTGWILNIGNLALTLYPKFCIKNAYTINQL
jgi:hypothetical protein